MMHGSPLSFLEMPEIMPAPENTQMAGKFYVVGYAKDHGGQPLFLHHNGAWHGCTKSHGGSRGWTGYFDSRAAAEVALVTTLH